MLFIATLISFLSGSMIFNGHHLDKDATKLSPFTDMENNAKTIHYTHVRKKTKGYIQTLLQDDSLLRYARKHGYNYTQLVNLMYSGYNCKAISNWLQYFPIDYVKYAEDYYASKCAIIGMLVGKKQDKIHLIDSILLKNDVPIELKYLAVIESYLNNRAFSRVGATGVWQFMRYTGREMGLKITKYTDQRIDLAKSTEAAAKYLNQLHNEFHNWLLVIAAYNCGPGKVRRIVHKYKSDDFWTIQKYLPQETQSHVKKFIATLFLMEIMLNNGNDYQVLHSPFFASITDRQIYLTGEMGKPKSKAWSINKPETNSDNLYSINTIYHYPN